MSKLNAHLDSQSQEINKAIVEHTQKLIGRLTNDMNTLYREIQNNKSSIPPIRLALPDEDDSNQQRVQLLIDFSLNRKGVAPSGYLSDSQIHTLALSLRLSAIRLFNKGLPIIILDDIVTSYDADHRKNIAATIEKHFKDYQVITVTHDERFFNYLRDQLPQNSWNFKRIIELKEDFGPQFHDYKTPDEVIEQKIKDKQSIANELRQSQEEWLLDMCRDFQTKVIIRHIDRSYKYERSELASSLANFMKSTKIAVPSISGISNPFLNSLQKGEVENFGSHFSDNPNGDSSLGDEETRWKEFKLFRSMFSCTNCNHTRFQRPLTLEKPVCKECETPFSFTTSQTDMAAKG